MQALPHADHRGDDTGVVRIRREIAHERLVDLQGVDRKALQIAQARIPGPEVIERELHAHALEGLKHGHGGLRILHQEAFGQLELQIARIEASLRQDVVHSGNEIAGAQFHRGDVDGDAHRPQA
jgi:hypothetical protein